MNKKHWITLSPGESISKTLVDELVTKSCLVVERLPRAQRLVDPTTYGRGGRS
jgi:predicted DNA-binding protein (MmcQ/YjbR family)